MKAPGPKGLPLSGALYLMAGDRLKNMATIHEKFGDIVRLRVGTTSHHIVFHPDLAKHVLTKNSSRYFKGRAFEKARAFMGNGLAVSEGDFWRSQRRLMNPYFSRKAMEKFVPTMNRCIDQMLDDWEEFAKQEQSFDAFPQFQELVMRVIAMSFFGFDVPEKDIGEILDAVKYLLKFTTARIINPLDIPEALPLPSNIKYKKARATLDSIVLRIIQEERQKSTPSVTLLADLVRAADPQGGRKMTDRQLADEVMTMFVAGIDTSGNTLLWSFCNLAKYPHILAKAKSIVDGTLGKREPSFQDLPELDYLRQVICETLRLCPQNYIMSRDALEADTIEGYDIKPGSSLFIGTYLIHRRPDFWPDPTTFDPTRFETSRMEKQHRFAFIPFGAGQRKCIGFDFAIVEMTLALAKVLQRYEYKISNLDTLTPDPKWSMPPKQPVKTRVQRRT